MEYIGAVSSGPEGQETLEFHALLLTSHLSAMGDLGLYHTFWPCGACAILDPSCQEDALKRMQQCWTFCTEFVDKLIATDKLYCWFSFTRFQPFRELMVKAEHLESYTLDLTI